MILSCLKSLKYYNLTSPNFSLIDQKNVYESQKHVEQEKSDTHKLYDFHSYQVPKKTNVSYGRVRDYNSFNI